MEVYAASSDDTKKESVLFKSLVLGEQKSKVIFIERASQVFRTLSNI